MLFWAGCAQPSNQREALATEHFILARSSSKVLDLGLPCVILACLARVTFTVQALEALEKYLWSHSLLVSEQDPTRRQLKGFLILTCS